MLGLVVGSNIMAGSGPVADMVARVNGSLEPSAQRVEALERSAEQNTVHNLEGRILQRLSGELAQLPLAAPYANDPTKVANDTVGSTHAGRRALAAQAARAAQELGPDGTTERQREAILCRDRTRRSGVTAPQLLDPTVWKSTGVVRHTHVGDVAGPRRPRTHASVPSRPSLLTM
jgi:hypothetical protein